jgi:hypothetical protein
MGVLIICPRCKDTVDNLVNKYELLNTDTGEGQSISLEHAVCEVCVEELFIEITEQHKKKTT